MAGQATPQEIVVLRGAPAPLGASIRPNGINFAVYARHATAVTLLLFESGRHEPIHAFHLSPRFNRTGDIWHILVQGLDPTLRYGYRVERTPNENPQRYRYDADVVLVDPYARALSGGSKWGRTYRRFGEPEGGATRRRSLIVEDDFDWGLDQPLNLPLSDTIIYELHVRGFTRHPSSKVNYPGTFAGLKEKIPYLQQLGVTAVELMPVCEFEEMEPNRVNPITGERLLNYWGYNPIGFFAPKASYAYQGRNGAQVTEFKALVKALHEAGIEVILDVVLNHTGEGNEHGPTYSFRGLDNPTYYLLDPHTGAYRNYSGCGNTVNCNHPVVRDLILEVLRYWVMEMHVDGFRFDLASILGRGQDGRVLPNAPLLERIAHDPVLANTKLIAEAWDAAGLYQLGNFGGGGRWAELNGQFRDDIRRFVKGDPGMVPGLAARLLGSPDLYQANGRAPYHSVNFITTHDGFTLADLVSYNKKHNLNNGENNRDGCDTNFSWNCGCEGATDSEEINALRARQVRNFATLLLFAHGVPMLLAGDEFGRTQLGNNNAYCHDNEISWVNWDLLEHNASLFRFFKLLIQFRKDNALLRRRTFVSGDADAGLQISWHGVRVDQPDWSYHSRTLALHLSDQQLLLQPDHADLYLIANAHWEPHVFELPAPRVSRRWFRRIDTSKRPPHDICDPGNEVVLPAQNRYHVGPRSVVVLVGK